jgi:hypothetical protein
VRPSSVVRALLASARLVGFGAALCAFVLWVVLFIGEARVLQQDFGIIPATLVQSAIMAVLALVAAWASLRTASLVLVAVSVISFVPVGFYAMLLGDFGTWIGVCNLLWLAAGSIMAVCGRLARGERRNAVG